LEGHSLNNSSLAKAFLDWFHRASNIYNSADSWFETSQHGQTEYQPCEGKQTWAWKSGYSTVLDLIMVRHSWHEKHNQHGNKTAQLIKETSAPFLCN
jgi:hypothetical protein